MIQHAKLIVVTQVLLREGCRAAFLRANWVLLSRFVSLCELNHFAKIVQPKLRVVIVSSKNFTTECSKNVIIVSEILPANGK